MAMYRSALKKNNQKTHTQVEERGNNGQKY